VGNEEPEDEWAGNEERENASAGKALWNELIAVVLVFAVLASSWHLKDAFAKGTLFKDVPATSPRRQSRRDIFRDIFEE